MCDAEDHAESFTPDWANTQRGISESGIHYGEMYEAQLFATAVKQILQPSPSGLGQVSYSEESTRNTRHSPPLKC